MTPGTCLWLRGRMRDNFMETVKIEKEKLLAKLRQNRAAHRGLFLKAQAGYRIIVVRELDRMLKLARAGKQIPLQVRTLVIAPKDQTSDYDRVIAMLEWTQDKVVELDETEFSRYVRDNWSWSNEVSVSNSYYSKVK